MAATIDNFSDLNDTVNPTWTHLNAEIGSSGQTWDASTGEYRLKAPPNGANVPPAGQLGFVASYTGPVSTDVLVSADIVEPTGSPAAVGPRIFVRRCGPLEWQQCVHRAYWVFLGIQSKWIARNSKNRNYKDPARCRYERCSLCPDRVGSR